MLDSYLESTEYLDADHPLVAALAEKLTHGAESDVERIRAIYLYVRDLRYDVLASFRYLSAGRALRQCRPRARRRLLHG